MTKKRSSPSRAGRTHTFSVSVDAETRALLKAAADRWHGGNVSQLVTAVARRLRDDEAFASAWEWYGGPTPTAAENAAIDTWIDRLEPRKPRSRRAA